MANTLSNDVNTVDDDDVQDWQDKSCVSTLINNDEYKLQYKNESCITESIHTLGIGHSGKWPNSTVPYVIHNDVEKGLRQLIQESIEEFHLQTPVKWKKKKSSDLDYISFQQTSDSPFSQGPCLFEGRQLINLSYPCINPSSSKMTKVGVMHEMMHSLGFLHEHQRPDAKTHHQVSIHQTWDYDFKLSGKNFGNYDYLSIMHYPCSIIRPNGGTSSEMSKYVGQSISFSRGDLAAVRRLYGKTKDCHYGSWHNPCSNKNCNKYSCFCNSCGKIKSGDVWCGFHGKRNDNGHWTCCFDEDKDSIKCKNRNHTGFWHMPCDQKICTDTKCNCGSCGVGCTHIGKKSHWSCCNQEQFEVDCNKKDSFI